MRQVSFKINEEIYMILEEIARRSNLTVSEVIRRAIYEYIANKDDRPFISKRIKIW